MRGRFLRWMLLIAVLATLQGGAGRALACEPIEMPEGPSPTPVTQEAIVQAADVIFEGVVVDHENGEDYGPAIVEVERYFKGSGPAQVLVRGFGWGTDCLPTIEVGQRGLFYASGNPDDALQHNAAEFDMSTLSTKIDAVIALVGHAGVAPEAPRPDATETVEVTPTRQAGSGRATSEPAGGQEEGAGGGTLRWLLIGSLAILLGIGLGAGVWAIRRRR
jgi:hypothetical protein